MGRKRRSHLGAWATAITLSFSAATALAYVLPADAILSSVAKRRDQVDIAALALEGTYERTGEPAHPIRVAVNGKALRIEHVLADGTEIELTTGGRRWRFSLGGPKAAPERVDDDLILTFVMNDERDPGGKRGTRFAEKLGISTEIVTLGRQERRAVYIIGAKPWEPDKPQLWIDKRYSVPVRLIQVDKKTNVKTETRLLGFGTEMTGEWFPRRIERYKNGALVDAYTFTKIELNPSLESNLFTPPS